MLSTSALTRTAAILEKLIGIIVITGVLFRATVYHRFTQTDGRSYTTGDIVDFALLAALFVSCTLCASCGVALALSRPQPPRAVIYRPVLVGMTCFVVYYFAQPLIPRLV